MTTEQTKDEQVLVAYRCPACKAMASRSMLAHWDARYYYRYCSKPMERVEYVLKPGHDLSGSR